MSKSSRPVGDGEQWNIHIKVAGIIRVAIASHGRKLCNARIDILVNRNLSKRGKIQEDDAEQSGLDVFQETKHDSS